MAFKKSLFYFVFLFCFVFSILPVYADLEVSEKHLDFGVLMRPKTKKLTIEVFNNSDSPFLGSISCESKWVKITPAEIALSPNEKFEISFFVDSSSLDPGDYRADIKYNAIIGKCDINSLATCTIIEGKNDPILKISSESIDFGTVERGENPLNKIVLENIGSGILDLSVSYPDWMIADDQVKIMSTQRLNFYYRALTKHLLPDTYKGELVFKDVAGEMTKIPISIKVKARPNDPIITVGPKLLDLGTVKKGRRARGKFKVGNKGKDPFDAKLIYPKYAVDPMDELKDVTKERSILLVIDTKNLPVGVTTDSIRLTSDYGIVDIPFKVTVK